MRRNPQAARARVDSLHPAAESLQFKRRATSRGGLPGGRRGVEDYDEECGDGAEEQGNQKPKKAAAILRLREPGIDQAQGSPADVIARLGERENHAPMVARSGELVGCSSADLFGC